MESNFRQVMDPPNRVVLVLPFDSQIQKIFNILRTSLSMKYNGWFLSSCLFCFWLLVQKYRKSLIFWATSQMLKICLFCLWLLVKKYWKPLIIWATSQKVRWSFSLVLVGVTPHDATLVRGDKVEKNSKREVIHQISKIPFVLSPS